MVIVPHKVVSDGSQVQHTCLTSEPLLLVLPHPQEKNLNQVDRASNPLWLPHGVAGAEMGLGLLEEVI